MMKGLKVGAYVSVLPTHKNAFWIEMCDWPAKVVKVIQNDEFDVTFQLENCKGTWEQRGLFVVNRNLENK